jgi:hypothetical protein
MKARSDTERILDAYLAPEADRLADRVIDAALADIARTPQRRSWRPAWRSNRMNTYAKVIAAAAAVLVVAVVGYQFLPRNDNIGGQPTAQPSSTATSSPTAQPSPTATSSPTAAAIPLLPEGTLAAGTYRLRPFSSETMTIDATVPDDGWLGGPPNAIGGPVGESNGPNGVFVAFLKAQTIHSDPCHWDKDGSGSAPQEGDIEVGPTVDDLAEALAANASYESTTPVEATLGGYSGKRLELQLVPDPSGCDTFTGEGGQSFVFGGLDGGQYAQGGANTWQVTIVDVEGTRLIAVLVAYEETSAADLSAAEGILESVVITP